MRHAGRIATLAFGFLMTACALDDMDGTASGLAGGGDIYAGEEKSSGFVPHAFMPTAKDSLSTFGLDVDKAAYTFHRKKIAQEGALPSPQSVRTEEFINFFAFTYPEGQGDGTFRIAVDAARSPFREDVVNLRIGLEAPDTREPGGPWNLTFLVDVSGSMTTRLDLVKKSLYRLVDAMREGDRISIATYAGAVTTVLEPTTLEDKDKAAIKGIIEDLAAGGGTAMSDGLENAYQVNRMGFLAGGVNRVIVCSDGDANIGATTFQEMLDRIRHHKEKGITLSTLGFGLGNYNDATMEMLADRGNGNYYYIDTEAEAIRLFGEELTAMMRVVAWDARIQVAFRGEAVKSYRLLGYENRDIADTAFKADTTDAGEIGAGHTVTALYELELADPAAAAELGKVSLRYRDASGATRDLERSLGTFAETAYASASRDLRFAVAVAEYAEVLRGSEYTKTKMADLARMVGALDVGEDAKRKEFQGLVSKAAGLKPGPGVGY